jgi:hypothetical protein
MLVTGAKDMGEAVQVQKVRPEMFERLARFAHEGLPYMTGDENWFDYNKDWAINIWWNWEEMQYRATAYKKNLDENNEIILDLKRGLDLF